MKVFTNFQLVFWYLTITVDEKYRESVAVKRNISKYVESAEVEAEILNNIHDEKAKLKRSKLGYAGASYIVNMYSSFHYHGHYCMVFEPLGTNI